MNPKLLFATVYLAVLSLGYFYSVLDGSLLLTERDLSVFFIPPRLEWVESVRGLTLPLWNPYSLSGHPLLATLQPGVFYPPNLLLVVLPFDLAFNWSIIIHYPLAGIFTFMLIRELKGTGSAALLGSVTFMLSGYLFSVHNVMSTLFSVAWTPLVILLYLRSIRLGSVYYAALTGVFLTVMFTAGGVEVVFATIILLILMVFIPGLFKFDENHQHMEPLASRAVLLAISGGVFVLLSAVQLLPFLELAGKSIRAGGLSYEEATTWSFAFRDLVQFFIPDPFGYGVTDEKYWANQSWLKTVYLGPLPFILSVFFLVRKRFRTDAFVLVSLGFFLMAMGGNIFTYKLLFNYFPFFDKIRYPVKFLFIPFLFISIAAGLGLDNIYQTVDLQVRRTRRIALALLAFSTLAALCLGLLSYYGAEVHDYLLVRGIDFPEYNHVDINIFNAKRFLVFFILSSIVVYAGVVSAHARRVLPVLLILLVTVDLFFAHNGYYHTTPAEEYHGKGEVLKYLDKDDSLYRVFVTPKTMKEPVEVAGDGGFDAELIRGMNLDKERFSGYNIEHHEFDLNGYEVMGRGDYSSIYNLLINQKEIDSTNLPGMMNVKYVVSIPKITSPEFELKKIVGALDDNPAREDEGSIKIYENKKNIPRFYTVSGYRVIKDPKEYVEILSSKEWDPEELVLLESDPGLPSLTGDGHDAAGSQPTVTEYGNNRVTLETACTEPCLLVASESYYGGWRAYVDGVGTRILKANYIYRAVPVPPGTHEVRFVYKPWSFRIGLVISLVTAALLLAAPYYFRKKQRIDSAGVAGDNK